MSLIVTATCSPNCQPFLTSDGRLQETQESSCDISHLQPLNHTRSLQIIYYSFTLVAHMLPLLTEQCL